MQSRACSSFLRCYIKSSEITAFTYTIYPSSRSTILCDLRARSPKPSFHDTFSFSAQTQSGQPRQVVESILLVAHPKEATPRKICRHEALERIA
jgi:hypothetical protein